MVGVIIRYHGSSVAETLDTPKDRMADQFSCYLFRWLSWDAPNRLGIKAVVLAPLRTVPCCTWLPHGCGSGEFQGGNVLTGPTPSPMTERASIPVNLTHAPVPLC
jgi:hypothetical protein